MAFLELAIRMLTALLVLIFAYQSLVGLLGLLPTVKRRKASAQLRFAFLISARNEERVIGQLIDSMNRQNYPRDAFDVFVIADNCTDRTGAVAETHGATVYYRHDLRKVGKGYALHWFFEQFNDRYAGCYDVITVLDADNLVDPGYLAAMNQALSEGYDAVIGHRVSKNPNDSTISAVNSIAWWFNNRFYNRARARVHLPTMISGSGFAILAKHIADGWHTQTITEDLELTGWLIDQGCSIGYTADAISYDEQPISLAVSFRQRQRWAVGQVQNLRRLGPQMIGGLWHDPRIARLDLLFYLTLIPLCLIQLILSVAGFVASLSETAAVHWPAMFVGLITPLSTGFALLIAQALLTLFLEKRFSLTLLKGALVFPLFVYSNVVLFVLALATPNLRWHPIEHKRAVSLNQIQSK